VSNVHWADVSGVDNVKHEVMEAIELTLRFPHLFAACVKRRAGLLLYGPPDTGKTLVAKAVATECALNFMSVKGTELLNMCTVCSLVRGMPNPSSSSSMRWMRSHRIVAPDRIQAALDRVVSALLAELDGAAVNSGVFVIAATNRPDLLESGLLRPGRLDRCVYLGVSETRAQQLNILKALTRKFTLAADVDLSAVVDRCTFTMPGADFYALASDALLHAIKR
jgi:peroxin-6